MQSIFVYIYFYAFYICIEWIVRMVELKLLNRSTLPFHSNECCHTRNDQHVCFERWSAILPLVGTIVLQDHDCWAVLWCDWKFNFDWITIFFWRLSRIYSIWFYCGHLLQLLVLLKLHKRKWMKPVSRAESWNKHAQ